MCYTLGYKKMYNILGYITYQKLVEIFLKEGILSHLQNESKKIHAEKGFIVRL